jgi:hypothetical protein
MSILVSMLESILRADYIATKEMDGIITLLIFSYPIISLKNGNVDLSKIRHWKVTRSCGMPTACLV